jgi:hypothetical protein
MRLRYLLARIDHFTLLLGIKLLVSQLCKAKVFIKCVLIDDRLEVALLDLVLIVSRFILIIT